MPFTLTVFLFVAAVLFLVVMVAIAESLRVRKLEQHWREVDEAYNERDS